MKTPAGASKPSASSAAAPAAAPAPTAAETALDAATPEKDESLLSSSPSPSSLSSTTTTTAQEPLRRKILCNPSAGDVHRRERGAPWRVDVDEKLRAANARAKDEQLEKRRWGLAKQIQDGLMHTYGMNYGVAELSTLLKTGLALKAQQTQSQQSQGHVSVPVLASHEVAYVQLLAAAEKYDLKQVVMLLDKFPKGRNSSNNSSSSAKPK